jgi:hypothetical protein
MVLRFPERIRVNLLETERGGGKTYLEVSQQPDVSSDLVGSRTQRSQGCKDVRVDLPRVSLGSNRVGIFKAGKLGDKLVKLFDLLVVTIEESQETALGTGCAFDTTESKVVPSTLQVAEIPQQFLSKSNGRVSSSLKGP